MKELPANNNYADGRRKENGSQDELRRKENGSQGHPPPVIIRHTEGRTRNSIVECAIVCDTLSHVPQKDKIVIFQSPGVLSSWPITFPWHANKHAVLGPFDSLASQHNKLRIEN